MNKKHRIKEQSAIIELLITALNLKDRSHANQILELRREHRSLMEGRDLEIRNLREALTLYVNMEAKHNG